MLSGVVPSYGDDSSYGCPLAAGRGDGVRRLWCLLIAGGRLREEVREPDLPPCSRATKAKSCGTITALGPTSTVTKTRLETS